MVFNQSESSTPLSSNWIYVQLDQGTDELLTKHNIFESFQQAGIEGIRNIRIYNDDCAQELFPEPVKEKKEDEIKKKITNVIKMANKSSRPQKAYGFIEFQDVESKQAALSSQYRLFGMEIREGVMVTENADLKMTLKVGNLPWNLDPIHFLEQLNEELSYARSRTLKNIRFNSTPE